MWRCTFSEESMASLGGGDDAAMLVPEEDIDLFRGTASEEADPPSPTSDVEAEAGVSVTFPWSSSRD